jgi:hypothetical protein
MLNGRRHCFEADTKHQIISLVPRFSASGIASRVKETWCLVFASGTCGAVRSISTAGMILAPGFESLHTSTSLTNNLRNKSGSSVPRMHSTTHAGAKIALQSKESSRSTTYEQPLIPLRAVRYRIHQSAEHECIPELLLKRTRRSIIYLQRPNIELIHPTFEDPLSLLTRGRIFVHC